MITLALCSKIKELKISEEEIEGKPCIINSIEFAEKI